LDNGKQIIVKVNDRGPFASHRVMDLSYAAAKKLGYAEKGTAHVQIDAITFAHHTHQTNSASSHYLQIGAFENKATAEHLKVKVAQLTHQSARIQAANLKHKTVYRVQIGPLKDTQQSAMIDELLQQEGFNPPILVNS